MKIKIIGDGTLGGTRVVDAETNEHLEYITSITWHLDNKSGLSTAIVVFQYVPVEVSANVSEMIARFPSRRWFQIYVHLKWTLATLIRRFPGFKIMDRDQ